MERRYADLLKKRLRLSDSMIDDELDEMYETHYNDQEEKFIDEILTAIEEKDENTIRRLTNSIRPVSPITCAIPWAGLTFILTSFISLFGLSLCVDASMDCPVGHVTMGPAYCSRNSSILEPVRDTCPNGYQLHRSKYRHYCMNRTSGKILDSNILSFDSGYCHDLLLIAMVGIILLTGTVFLSSVLCTHYRNRSTPREETIASELYHRTQMRYLGALLNF